MHKTKINSIKVSSLICRWSSVKIRIWPNKKICNSSPTPSPSLLITSWPVAIETWEPPSCGFPVSCLVLGCSLVRSVMITHKSACSFARWPSQFHLNACIQSHITDHGWDTCNKCSCRFSVWNTLLFLCTSFCVRSVGPPPELVRQREAKWINIISQWERILTKKSSKVSPGEDTEKY